MGPDHATTEAVFQRHVRGEGRLGRAEPQLPQGDLQGLRRFGPQSRQLGHRPVGTVGLQRGEDFLDRVKDEQAVDGLAVSGGGRRTGIGGETGGHRLGVVRMDRQRGLERLDPIGGDKMGVDAQRHRIRRLKPRPGQGQPDTGLARQPRQEPAAADIGEQANAGLGHGIGGAFSGDADVRRLRNAHAAAHDDAIDDRRDRLGIVEHQMVQPVFDLEEGSGLRRIPGPALGDHPDVSPGAEAAFSGVVDQHRMHAVVATPRQQGLRHRLAHGAVQRVQRLGPIQGDAAHAGINADQDFRLTHGAALGAAPPVVQTEPRHSHGCGVTVRAKGMNIARSSGPDCFHVTGFDKPETSTA